MAWYARLSASHCAPSCAATASCAAAAGGVRARQVPCTRSVVFYVGSACVWPMLVACRAGGGQGGGRARVCCPAPPGPSAARLLLDDGPKGVAPDEGPGLQQLFGQRPVQLAAALAGLRVAAAVVVVLVVVLVGWSALGTRHTARQCAGSPVQGPPTGPAYLAAGCGRRPGRRAQRPRRRRSCCTDAAALGLLPASRSCPACRARRCSGPAAAATCCCRLLRQQRLSDLPLQHLQRGGAVRLRAADEQVAQVDGPDQPVAVLLGSAVLQLAGERCLCGCEAE